MHTSDGIGKPNKLWVIIRLSMMFDFSENLLSALKARITGHFELQLMNGSHILILLEFRE